MRPALPLLAALLAAAPARAREVTLLGRAALRGLYSRDSGDNPRAGFLFLETDLSAERVTDDGLRLHLDATFLLDMTDANERRFGETESLDQVRELYVEQPEIGGRVDVSVGRRLLWQAGHAWVDGVAGELHVDGKRASVGAFGGLSPDRFDYALTTRYQTAGLYGTLHRDGFDAALAYTSLLREGSLDRHYVFNRLHARLAEGLFAASYLVADLVDDPQITTLLASLDYTPVPAVNLALNLSRYSVEQYRNQTVYHDVIEPNQALILGDEVVKLNYNRARFSASLRFGGHFYQYQSIEAKSRSQDDRAAWSYTVGLRDDDVLGSQTRVDVRTALSNGFQSDAWLVALTADRDFGERFGGALRLTWFDGQTIGRATERGRTFDEAQAVLLFGLTAFYRPGQRHQIAADYDGVYEAELQDARNQANLFIQTFMGRYTYLF